MVSWGAPLPRFRQRAQPRVEHLLAGRDLLHGVHHFQIHRVLQKVAARARFQAGAHIEASACMLRIRIAVPGRAPQNVARGDRAVHAGSAKSMTTTRLESAAQLHRLVAVLGFADHAIAGSSSSMRRKPRRTRL